MDTDDKVTNMLAGLADRYKGELDLEQGLERLRDAGYGLREEVEEAEDRDENVSADGATVVVRVGHAEVDLERVLGPLRAAGHGLREEVREEEENREENVSADGAIVMVGTNPAGEILSVEVIPKYKQRPVLDDSSQTSLGDLTEDNQPSDAYDEDDHPTPLLIDVGLPSDVIVFPRPEGQPPHRDDSATEAPNIPRASTPESVDVIDEIETEPGSSAVVEVHRKSRSHVQDLQWITAIWAMALVTVVVLAGVVMWVTTGGAIDLEPYVRSGVITGITLAFGAWAFKMVTNEKKDKGRSYKSVAERRRGRRTTDTEQKEELVRGDPT